MTAQYLGCTIARIDVTHGVDWNEGVQLYAWALSGTTPYRAPLDLTNTRQRLIVRPGYEHPVQLFAADTLTGEILVAAPTTGAVQFFAVGLLISTLPVGEWRFVWDILINGGWKPLARGPFVVNPGR